MKNKGFTLIEMLVVIVIIGIIIAIVIPTVSILTNNREKKLLKTHLEMVDVASNLYIDQYKGQFAGVNKNCFEISYTNLLNEGLTESEVKCNGSIIITKSGNGNSFTKDYYLSCRDNKNTEIIKSEDVPTGCFSFNGKFYVTHELYLDSSKSESYDANNFSKKIYIYLSNVNPYEIELDHYEYRVSNGKWKVLENGSNLASLEGLEDLVGSLSVRAVDKEENFSDEHLVDIKLDNSGPIFTTRQENVEIGSNDIVTKTSLIIEASDDGIGLSDQAYSFDGGITWQSDNFKEYDIETTTEICVIDKLENKNCKEITVTNVDGKAPVILANASKQYYHASPDDKTIDSYYTVTYGTSGGSTVCKLSDTEINNTSQLTEKQNTLNCVATGTNGKIASTDVQINYEYNATFTGYTCKSGTPKNDKCVNTEYTDYKKGCPDGGTLSADKSKCVTVSASSYDAPKKTATPNSNQVAKCSGQCVIISTSTVTTSATTTICNSYLSKNRSGCYNTYGCEGNQEGYKKVISTSRTCYTCEAGYSLTVSGTTGTCSKYHCPNGGTLNGTKCNISESSYLSKDICPEGYSNTIAGCAKNVETDADKNYNCPNGGTKVGSKCQF